MSSHNAVAVGPCPCVPGSLQREILSEKNPYQVAVIYQYPGYDTTTYIKFEVRDSEETGLPGLFAVGFIPASFFIGTFDGYRAREPPARARGRCRLTPSGDYVVPSVNNVLQYVTPAGKRIDGVFTPSTKRANVELFFKKTICPHLHPACYTTREIQAGQQLMANFPPDYTCWFIQQLGQVPLRANVDPVSRTVAKLHIPRVLPSFPRDDGKTSDGGDDGSDTEVDEVMQ
jgi:hypothetical protein